MAGYLNCRKLTNVKGRIEYATDPNRQENIVDFYNTADNEFWELLAKENQVRHKELKSGGKCCEARELIIGIPQNSKITAEELCNIFKTNFGVECTCAIHENNRRNVKNRHCHLIFSERTKLETPQIVEEKRAVRTYFYDQKGNKCPKAQAVKVVKKGTVLQEGKTQYFSNKDELFKSSKFVYQCKELFLKQTLGIDWSYAEDKQNHELAEQHIGKNNPKKDYIELNNNLKSLAKKVCKAGDILTNAKGTTLQELKRNYNITSFATPCFEENEHKVYDFAEEMQLKYKNAISQNIYDHNKTNDDLRELQINDNSFIYRQIHNMIIDNYAENAKTREKPKILTFLTETITTIFKRVKKLVDTYNELLCFDNKDTLELEQDRRNGNLHLENENYIREQKENTRDDYDLEM